MTAALVLGPFAGAAASAAPAPVTIDIVTTNDFHGRLAASAPAGGAAVLAGMVDAFRAANPNTIFAAAGDLVGASTFPSYIQQDTPTIDAFNTMKLDVSALGNHEFDHGTTDLDGRIIPAAHWPYLSANIYTKGTTTPAYDPYFVKVVDGVRIGFIGATTAELPSLVSPTGIATLEVGAIVPAVNRVADQLSDGNQANGEADALILLVHEGAASPALADATDNSVFGQIVSGVNSNVDAIVSGHTHVLYNHEILIPGTSTVRPVLQDGQYGENFGHLALSVDPTTHALLSITSETKPLFGAFPPDPAVAAIVADAAAVASVKGSVPVGRITSDFSRASQADGSENRGGESPLGNFVADVQLWATKDASSQIALMNPGGLRSNLTVAADPATPGDAAGVITYQEAASVQPFANSLVALDLTTAQLRAVLEEQWQPAQASRPFLKLGLSKSLSYLYDPAASAGNHITSMFIDGSPVDPAGSYRVTVNSFLASGGDNFSTFALGTNRQDTGKVDLQSMVDYFVAFPTVSPDYSQRSVGVHVVSSPTGPVAGAPVTLELSSLLFSNAGPRASAVTASIGGVVLASAALDPTVVDTTDEVGRSTLTLALPAGLTGAQTITVTVRATGSTVAVPLTVAAAADPGHGGVVTGVAADEAILPVTGADVGSGLALGATFAAIGVLLIGVARLRRSPKRRRTRR